MTDETVNHKPSQGMLFDPSEEDGSPEATFEVLLVTGMSGAGRTRAADALEDMGWYVIDNLPPKMLVPLVDMMTSAGSTIHKLAAVIDVRSRDYFHDLLKVMNHLEELNVRSRILFLDCDDDVLVKRYEFARRPHPLQHGRRLIDGIHEERELLTALKKEADIVIDTSLLNIHQLSTRLYEVLLGQGPETVRVHVFSFGFKYGLPTDADFIADVRFLPNPFWVPELKGQTGLDKPVQEYVMDSPGAQRFLADYSRALMTAIAGFAKEDKHYVTIGVGCTGGQHRSVVMAQELAQTLRRHGLSVTVSAREIDAGRYQSAKKSAQKSAADSKDDTDSKGAASSHSAAQKEGGAHE